MKKLLTCILVFGVLSSASSQKIGFWFDAGVKAGFGPSFLLNSNILDDNSYKHVFSNGYSVGAKFGIFYGLWNGVTFDIMYNTGIQKFRNEGADMMIDQKLKWNSTDLAVLYRMQKAGIYIEIGPMFSFLNKVDDTYDNSTNEVTDNYNENMINAVFGFGGYLMNSAQFTLMFGLRTSYGFTDFISDEGQDAGYPNPNVVVAYETYEKTNPISLQLVLEANFGIGYFAKTACSKRTSFFRFD